MFTQSYSFPPGKTIQAHFPEPLYHTAHLPTHPEAGRLAYNRFTCLKSKTGPWDHPNAWSAPDRVRFF